jgi:nucleoside 2-deoxyribosyltransferase
MKSAFLAIPVTDSLSSNGEFRTERRLFFSAFITVLHECGVEVMSAATHESWGRVKLTPREFTAYDVESLLKADALIVVTNERLNRDMYLELGLAVARGIPVILIIAASTRLTYMALGMEELGMIEVHRYDADADAPNLLRDAMARLRLSQARRS